MGLLSGVPILSYPLYKRGGAFISCRQRRHRKWTGTRGEKARQGRALVLPLELAILGRPVAPVSSLLGVSIQYRKDGSNADYKVLCPSYGAMLRPRRAFPTNEYGRNYSPSRDATCDRICLCVAKVVRTLESLDEGVQGDRSIRMDPFSHCLFRKDGREPGHPAE